MADISDWKSQQQSSQVVVETPYTILVFLDDVLFGCVIAADEEKGFLVQHVPIGSQNVQITRKGKVKILVNGIPVSKILVSGNFG